jgi:hypothetical protein
MKALVQISRYWGRTLENFQLLRRSDFRFFRPLRPNSLNRHAREFHLSGARTLVAYGQDYQICVLCGTVYECDWVAMRRTRPAGVGATGPDRIQKPTSEW